MRVGPYDPSTSASRALLCASCQGVVARIGTPPGSWDGPEPEQFAYPARVDTWRGAHHTIDSGFISSVEKGCYICNALLEMFPKQERSRAQSSRTFYEICPNGHRRWALRFTIELPAGFSRYETPPQVIECEGAFKILPESALSRTPVKLKLEDDTSSEPCKSQIRTWLSRCTHGHSLCNEDWRTTTQYSMRLLNVSDTNIRLEEFGPGTGPNKYVTLSHCWNNSSERSLSQLKTSNLTDLRRGFAESSLPGNFRHAIAVARSIGINYLWIDALCIIQDSEDDWREQSNIMDDIYAGTHCNIAALNQVGEAGFLGKRRLEIIEPFLMRDPERASRSTTHIIGYDDFWCNSLLSSSLHNRAWVLQERLLSPRTIHFGEQIFWDCREHKACETYPTGIPDELSNHRTKAWRQSEQVLSPKSKVHPEPSQKSWLGALQAYLLPPRPVDRLIRQKKAYEYWSTAVEHYMRCELSHATDKLVAIQGLANKVHDMTGERYLAGLWDSPDLAHSLLWYTPGRQQANGRPSAKHGPRCMRGYRAPSWSWASLDAKIVWKWPSQCGQLLLRIEEIITQSHSDVASEASHPSEIRVSGRLIPVELQITSDYEDGSPDEDGSYAVEPRQANSTTESLEMIVDALSASDPTILLDEALVPRCTINVDLLPVVTEWRGRPAHPAAEVAGLILRRPSFNSRAVYERIGVFCFDKIPTDDNLLSGGGNSLQAAFSQRATERVILI
ncbi:uncharacterized protein PV07_12753 [Cladophialophora immunda]|uniref:Heterokaryon incompatibility domain-containing protein n=1 Tax=Cladophialophora immunda TaxID=569365 RepID=A0A0D2BRY4_9EURO|nr:uncharacterized protein PV07_12753 [Cladophialophora immunda]KIW21823.1 hypothetical protein PV07_12753 [Cladophialophora immunda]